MSKPMFKLNAKNSLESKQLLKKHEQQPTTNNDVISSTFGNSKPPKLENRSKEVNLKLDQLLKDNATKEDISQLASSDDLQQLRNDMLENNKNVRNEITAKMSNQTSKLVDVAKSTRDIAYNNGLQADITQTRQQVDALQKRQDMSNIHMDEVTRQNEAMNADLKQIGPAISKVVDAQNKNSEILSRALAHGFHVNTDKVTIAVSNEFKKITGFTINKFLQNEIVKGMNNNIYEAMQAKLTAIQAAQMAEEALEKVSNLINYFASLMVILVVELGVIVVVGLILPGWWKVVGIVVAVAGAGVINHYISKENDSNGV